MSQISSQQIDAIRLAALAIVDAAKVAAPMGAPSGIVYAALMAHGMKLTTYQSLLNSMQGLGLITVSDDHLIRLVVKA